MWRDHRHCSRPFLSRLSTYLRKQGIVTVVQCFLVACHVANRCIGSLFSRLPGYNVFNSDLPDPALNSNTVCKNTPSLNKEQMRMCQQAPEVVASALQGIQIAIHECRDQLRYRRWNCSALEGKSRNLKAVGLLSRGKLRLRGKRTHLKKSHYFGRLFS